MGLRTASAVLVPPYDAAATSNRRSEPPLLLFVRGIGLDGVVVIEHLVIQGGGHHEAVDEQQGDDPDFEPVPPRYQR